MNRGFLRESRDDPALCEGDSTELTPALSVDKPYRRGRFTPVVGFDKTGEVELAVCVSIGYEQCRRSCFACGQAQGSARAEGAAFARVSKPDTAPLRLPKVRFDHCPEIPGREDN